MRRPSCRCSGSQDQKTAGACTFGTDVPHLELGGAPTTVPGTSPAADPLLCPRHPASHQRNTAQAPGRLRAGTGLRLLVSGKVSNDPPHIRVRIRKKLHHQFLRFRDSEERAGLVVNAPPPLVEVPAFRALLPSSPPVCCFPSSCSGQKSRCFHRTEAQGEKLDASVPSVLLPPESP